ncbi:MAG: hypothetical protein K2M06_00910 [Muribaculaceae bacterium]|nr:hypothetical protein [Muribaculaceae bacterium]
MGRSLNPRWWQLLRHRKGYGIHSPFAYRFITEVLNPSRKYRYYAEETEKNSNGRILARLSAFLNTDKGFYHGSAAKALSAKQTASTAISDANILVVDLKSTPIPPEILERIGRGNVAVLCFHHSRGRIDPLLEAMPYGMSFRNRSTRAVLVVDPKLPRQDFWVQW